MAPTDFRPAASVPVWLRRVPADAAGLFAGLKFDERRLPVAVDESDGCADAVQAI